MNGYKKGDKLSGSQMHKIGYNSPYPVKPVSSEQIQQMKYANKPSDLPKQLPYQNWYAELAFGNIINWEAVAKEYAGHYDNIWGYSTASTTNEPYKEKKPEDWL
jgi:hypothetical protein